VSIGDAFRAIARGDIRAALAGGVEAPLSPLIFGAFTVIRAMSTRNADPAGASRPFDLGRDGFVMGEGSGVLFIERLDDALARDAHIYGEIVGFGLTNDAHHMSAPRPDGSVNASAMERALREAGVAPADVDVVNAHGSGTPLGDKSEALAIGRVFAGRPVPVSATKGQHGHALGATGAWEAALSLLSFAHQIVPKTVNHTEDDPDCSIAITRSPIETLPRIVLSNSAGFGGINAALVFRRYE
jgi:3-oxoacyl-[acyl-carrier-protein] synthase II